MASSFLDFYGKLHQQVVFDQELRRVKRDGRHSTQRLDRNRLAGSELGHFLSDPAKKSDSFQPSEPARKAPRIPVMTEFVTPTRPPARQREPPLSEASGRGKSAGGAGPPAAPSGLLGDASRRVEGRAEDQVTHEKNSLQGVAAPERAVVRNPFMRSQWLPASAFQQPQLTGHPIQHASHKGMASMVDQSKMMSASAGTQPIKAGTIQALNLPTMKDDQGMPVTGIPDFNSVIRPLQLPPHSDPADPVQPLDLPGLQNLEYGNAEYGLPVPPEVVMTPASAAAAIAKGADPDAGADELNHHQFLFGAGRAPLFTGMPAPNSLHGMTDSASFLEIKPSLKKVQLPSGFLETMMESSRSGRSASLWAGAGLHHLVSHETLAEVQGFS